MSTILYWIDEDSGSTEHVELDVVDNETPEDVLTPTEHAVEEGANVTDHARLEPAFLTIEGIISNMVNPRIDTDLVNQSVEIEVPEMLAPRTKTTTLDVAKPGLQPNVTSLVNAGIGALSSLILGGPKFTHQDQPRRTTRTVKVTTLQQREPRDRIRDAYDLLLKAQSTRALVTVQALHREHFDMLITRIAKPRTIEDGKAARFQIDLRQIRVADSETVQSPEPTEARGKGRVSAGSKNGKLDPNAGAKEVQYESTLSMLIP